MKITAQFSDIFLMENKKYDIAGVNGELFVPEKFGMRPIGVITACWRGYVATYALLEDILVLNNLNVSLGKFTDNKFFPEIGPEINGIKPLNDSNSFNNFYKDLNLPIKLSGGILIANGFIAELYVHMGFHPAWKYKEVHELIFDEGKLKEKRNLSSKMAQIREELADTPLRPVLDEVKLSEWIDSTFRLDYDHLV